MIIFIFQGHVAPFMRIIFEENVYGLGIRWACSVILIPDIEKGNNKTMVWFYEWKSEKLAGCCPWKLKLVKAKFRLRRVICLDNFPRTQLTFYWTLLFGIISFDLNPNLLYFFILLLWILWTLTQTQAWTLFLVLSLLGLGRSCETPKKLSKYVCLASPSPTEIIGEMPRAFSWLSKYMQINKKLLWK